MRPSHFINLSGITAFAAILASLSLAFVHPAIQPVLAAKPVVVQHAIVTAPKPVAPTVVATSTKLGLPIADALPRVTKKTFGLEVHPATSPVANDKFNGYHVGVDFETTEAEQAIDVPIYAICDGTLLIKRWATGYGGVAVQSCKLDGKDITVLYGHLDIDSVTAKLKDKITRGQQIGVLGEGYSHETDGARKHLHLNIHPGTGIDIRGYVQKKSEIGQWLNALDYIKLQQEPQSRHDLQMVVSFFEFLSKTRYHAAKYAREIRQT